MGRPVGKHVPPPHPFKLLPVLQCPLTKGNTQSMPFYNIFFRMPRSTPTVLLDDVLRISMLHNFFWVSHSIPMIITDLGLTSLSSTVQYFPSGRLFYTCNKCQTYG